jgi:hypothetical protein
MRTNELVRVALLSISLLLLLPACESACPSPPTFVDVEGINLMHYSRQTGVLANGQVVRANDLMLRLELVERLYTASLPRRGGFAAWADCTPPEPTYTEQVDSLLVTSRNDYDAQHPAGTSLNDLIRITHRGGNVALQDFLTRPQGVESITKQYLTVTAPPARSANQQFQVRIHLVNGEVYKTAVSTIILQP